MKHSHTVIDPANLLAASEKYQICEEQRHEKWISELTAKLVGKRVAWFGPVYTEDTARAEVQSDIDNFAVICGHQSTQERLGKLISLAKVAIAAKSKVMLTSSDAEFLGNYLLEEITANS